MHNIKLLPSLLIFVDVARCRSFTKAAELNHLSKSAVSQHIKRLELHIGRQLLSRHTRGMLLTDIGESLLRQCELLKSQVDGALDTLDSSKNTPSGDFSITIPNSLEKNIVMPALTQLCAEYPLIEPRLIVTDEPLDLVGNKLDVSIYGGDLKDSNYRALPIGSATEVFCAAPSYLANKPSINSIAELKAHKFVCTSWQSNHFTLYKDKDYEDKLTTQLRLSFQTNTLSSAIEFVCRGIGLALLPKFSLQDEILNNRLSIVLPHYTGREWPFHLVHRFQGDKPVHVSRFYQLVKHYFNRALNH
ncbi:LysR family transcriptional regulator [Agaribacter marinus]|nr:LysR family transcriptional regulator [Agaribacter marinus]